MLKRFKDVREELNQSAEEVYVLEERKEELLARELTRKEKREIRKPFREEIKAIIIRIREINAEIKKLREEKGLLKARKSELYRMAKLAEEGYRVNKNSTDPDYIGTCALLREWKEKNHVSADIFKAVLEIMDTKDLDIQAGMIDAISESLQNDGYDIVRKHVKKITTREDRETVEMNKDYIVVIDPDGNEIEFATNGKAVTVLNRLKKFVGKETYDNIFNSIGDYRLNDQTEEFSYQPSFEGLDEIVTEEDLLKNSRLK